MSSWTDKKTLKFLLILLPLFFFWTTPAQAQKYQSLSQGLEYAAFKPKDSTVTLHLLRVDLKHFEIKPILAKHLGSKVLNAQDMAKKSNSVAVINANFFDKKNDPLGLVLINGKVRNGFHPTRWYAAFLTTTKRATIRKAFDKKQIAAYRNGIQAGPRLVISGRTPKLKL